MIQESINPRMNAVGITEHTIQQRKEPHERHLPCFSSPFLALALISFFNLQPPGHPPRPEKENTLSVAQPTIRKSRPRRVIP